MSEPVGNYSPQPIFTGFSMISAGICTSSGMGGHSLESPCVHIAMQIAYCLHSTVYLRKHLFEECKQKYVFMLVDVVHSVCRASG